MRLAWLIPLLFIASCTRSNSSAGCPSGKCSDMSVAHHGDGGAADLGGGGGADLGGTLSCTSPLCAGAGICLPPATCDGTSVCSNGALVTACGDGACDCGETATSCPADCACASGCQTAPGTCIADGTCGMTGTICMGTQIVSSCGDGTCDCGEDSSVCPADCGCPANACNVGSSCVAAGACTAPASGMVCAGGAVTSSCGDGKCDCGETQASCPGDCGGCANANDCSVNGSCLPQGTCEAGATGKVCKAGSFTDSCGDGVCDCGETSASCAKDCTTCPAGGCSDNGKCSANGTCEPTTPGQVCTNGAFASSCGDGKCDCGETPASCPGDCGCPAGECAAGGKCYPREACMGSMVCSGTAFVASCGDRVCDCGETAATCPGDCSTKCKNGTCAFFNVCVQAGACEPSVSGTGLMQSCQNGVFASSCGDGKCDCGETSATCPADCK